ncbi:TolC family protein [Arcobacter sp. FWKO B]|uniref:TolC family protein n=1 Tax=Arcobacter sp. FWKO B TaxID=2593672 RepID=UPI00190429DB|nr:TolC family protein [Arcobacter sp. FWKO B]
MKIFLIIMLFISSLFGFTLKEGFERTLQKDPEVQVRLNELKKIKYDIDIAKGLKYPSVDFRGTLETSKKTSNSRTPKSGEHTNSDEYSLNIRQPIYDGLEASYEAKLQNSRYLSAEYYLKEAQNLLALRYTESYINVLKTKDLLSASSESYQISEDIYNKITRKVQRGFGTKLEFESSKASLEESSVNLAIDKLNYNDAIATLRNHIQTKFDVNELVKPSFSYSVPNSEEEALDYALLYHPSMLVALTNVDVAISEYKRDLKAFQPNVNLVGQYKLNDSMYKEDNSIVSNEYKMGIELAYNLYNGGKDIAKKKKSLEYISEKRIYIDKSSQQISNRLALAWNSYTINQEKLRRLSDFLKTRQLVLDATIDEFDLGTKDLTSVLDAHSDYISTKRNTIVATYDLLYAHYRVLEAIGVLSDEILIDKRDKIWNNESNNIENLFKDVSKYLEQNYSVLEKSKANVSLEIEVLPLVENEVSYEYLDESSVNDINTTTTEVIQENIDSFKDRFLGAPTTKYTINLANSGSIDEVNSFLLRNGLQNDAFGFAFGADKTIYKIMYGIFDTFEEASTALEKLPPEAKASMPRVEIIALKQNLYRKYNSN